MPIKSATLPSLGVDAQLQVAAESVLQDGEPPTTHRCQAHAEFLARGLAAREDATRSGIYHQASVVHGMLQSMLDARRKQVLG